MAKPYSDDRRERAVAAIESGHTREEVAELYNLALSTVGGFIRRKRETGSVSPAKFAGHKTFALAPRTDLVKKLVAGQSDSTLAELKTRLAKEKIKVSQSAIFRFLRRLKRRLKKECPRGRTAKALLTAHGGYLPINRGFSDPDCQATDAPASADPLQRGVHLHARDHVRE
jgi:transposase